MTQSQPPQQPTQVLYAYKRIKSKPGKTRGIPVGVVCAALVDGKLRMGWALAHPGSKRYGIRPDTLNPARGRQIALNRALQPGTPGAYGKERLRRGEFRAANGVRSDTPRRLLNTEARLYGVACKVFGLDPSNPNG
jgi:hypothetical protein